MMSPSEKDSFMENPSPPTENISQQEININQDLSTSSQSDLSVSIEFKDINLTLGNKQILKNISGHIDAGQLVGVLGQSGSGKTSLLNLLSGQMEPSCWEGDVIVGGHSFNPLNWGSRLALVQQHCDLYPTLTPREIFEFSAMLRLPGCSEENIEEIINNIVKEVGIGKCADSKVGDIRFPGISGGEMKRVAIGNELINKPKCIFLDEPTSGLDSYRSYTIVKTLRNLSQSGATVCATIHQPSSEIIDLFDTFIILHNGFIVCQGTKDFLHKTMEDSGKPCPDHHNLLDHILFQIQLMDETTLSAFIDKYSNPIEKHVEGNIDFPSVDDHVTNASLSSQFYYLGLREIRNIYRRPELLILRCVIPSVLTLLYASVFWRITDDENVLEVFSAIFILTMSNMFGNSTSVLHTFAPDRPIFIREYRNKIYGIFTYFTIKNIIDSILSFVMGLPAFSIAYFAIGFRSNYLELYVCLWLFIQALTGMIMIIAVTSRDVITATNFFPLAVVPQIFFAGFYININRMPESLQWIQYICSLKYGLNLMLITELGGDYYLESAQNKLLDDNDIFTSHRSTYIGILIACAFFFRIIAGLSLYFSATNLIS